GEDTTLDYDGADEGWALPVVERFPAGEVKVVVSDEGSRLNLNLAPPAALARLPGMEPEALDAVLALRKHWLEVPEEVRAVERLAGRWPDLDKLVTTFGPVNPFASSEGLAALLEARGADEREVRETVFLVDELCQKPEAAQPESLEALRRQIPGLPESVWDRLKDDLVLDGTINVNLAPAEVLSALWAGLGLGAESRQRLLTARQGGIFRTTGVLWQILQDEAAAKALRPWLTVASQVFRLDVAAKSGGAQVALRVLVRRSWDEPGGRARFAVLSWAEVGQ
ncbi:MAG: type II secretion system protein GspK, partial [Methanocella sp.]